MSIEITNKGSQDYAYFYPGRNKKIYLGNVTDKNNLKINPDKVIEALDYMQKKNIHYSEVESQLISFLPQSRKDQYISKRIKELQTQMDNHVSSLSDSAKQQYMSKGKQTAEGQTRLRQGIENLEIIQDILGFAKKKTDKTTTEKISKYLQEKYGKNVRT